MLALINAEDEVKVGGRRNVVRKTGDFA